MQIKKIFLLSSFFLYSILLIAQQNYCGTNEGRSDWLKKFQENGINNNLRSEEWLIIPVVFHITGTDEGLEYTAFSQVEEAFCQMNMDFEQVNIQFFKALDYQYIDNTEWHNHTTFGQGRRMMNANNISGVVNIYICEDAAGNCGYYTGGPDAIAINNDCLGETGHTLAHEVGHYLDLPHPFFGWEGTTYDINSPTPQSFGSIQVEFVDGSNCTSAADGFCDTPPDYLSYRWPCNSNGESNTLQKDPDGAEFRSQGNLIMSYSTGDCRDYFSTDQIAAMRANIQNQRDVLLNHDREYQEPLPAEKLKVAYPENKDSVYYRAVSLGWFGMEGADYYLLEVSYSPSISNAFLRVEVMDTSYYMGNLDINRNYFWRVTPFAAQGNCASSNFRSQFKTTEFSNVTDPEADEANISSFFDLSGNLHITSNGLKKKENLDLILYSGSGQIVYHEVLKMESGASKTVITPGSLPAGLYILSLQSKNLQLKNRIIKL
jgi:hypothetical protein